MFNGQIRFVLLLNCMFFTVFVLVGGLNREAIQLDATAKPRIFFAGMQGEKLSRIKAPDQVLTQACEVGCPVVAAL